MAELGFQDQSSARSNYIARDSSPDSVIFTRESHFSVFSSASDSVDRSSFASDAARDHYSLVSELSLHLAGREGGDQNESSRGTVPAMKVHKPSRFSRKGEKLKVQQAENDAGPPEDDNQLIDSARNSFSVALKECQDRRTRSEALLKNHHKRRQPSLDLNNVSVSSPRLEAVKKNSVATRKSGSFPSPGAPNYHHHLSAGMQKGWSSEHVSLHNNGGRRQGNAAAALPFNNGRTLPSKWEDAERWIFSPVSGDCGVKQSIAPPLRRPISKSGPLGRPGIAYYSLYSPEMHMLDGGHIGNFMAGSPFSAGVVAADGLSIHSRNHGGGFAVRTEPCMARSVSVHGCSEVVKTSSLSSQDADENLDAVKDAATDISRTVSRRDMATQMSPQGSTHSSPKESPSVSPSNSSSLPIILQSIHSSKPEVRDVQVDERVTMARWSKKQRARKTAKSSEIVDDWRKRAVDSRTSIWDMTETAKNISKVKREEAKITSWENLQKAKADAAIRKLEMKLEKKRRSSLDKIMNKLRSAQKRAEEMRNLMLANQAHQVTKAPHKAISLRRTRQKGSLSGCFTCHAF
ncbi:hypothetical protein F3Y22_tig00112647pilonHSYRG00052 [Hibiscus syriacus]|uniref:Remorin C-terminal domain-containing protein n=1 Tax=Hibiscus syriacus TaxID=106335 RepID=A0A6A2WVI2_HIBSY|nr:uncharacterized protein LOC120182385 [Hibiscus syriacus]KAE8665211.1 hypothetical protein F3Y22_tig00112647pilonHSYRG00052 [Hibiscus syriacus]